MWNEKYRTEQYIYGTEPNEFLAQNVKAIPKGQVLCLADGEGRNSVFLAKQGHCVTAVDSSDVALAKAEKLAKENDVHVDFIHADLMDYDLGVEKWDGIVSIFCHIPKHVRESLHKNIATSLKQHGVILIEAYTPAQLKHGTGGPPTEDLMMTSETLTRELQGLKFHRLIELEREIVEGTRHTGLGAVVQGMASR
ncbi:MAG: class I SAM-dependent methyltransferase [Phycisphaerales bacterium]|nr:class I SAM-dependent methyltransferase [Phycisphaerales bacterium]